MFHPKASTYAGQNIENRGYTSTAKPGFEPMIMRLMKWLHSANDTCSHCQADYCLYATRSSN